MIQYLSWELPENDEEFTLHLLTHGPFNEYIDSLTKMIQGRWSQSIFEHEEQDFIDFSVQLSRWAGKLIWTFPGITIQYVAGAKENGVDYNAARVYFPDAREGLPFVSSCPSDEPFFASLANPPVGR